MDITIYNVSAVVITGIIAEVAKRAEVPTKFLPLLSLVAGAIVVSVGTWTFSVEAIITGIVIGAIASGLYDNVSKGIAIAKKK